VSRHTTSARIAAILGGLALLGSVLVVTAPAVAAVSPVRPLAHRVATYGTTEKRGRVNVTQLSRTPLKQREAHPRPAIRVDPATITKGTPPKAVSAAAAVAPVQATTTAGPDASVTSFAGLTQVTAGEADIEPPDPYLAVGPDDVMQVVNLMTRITDRNGGNVMDAPLGDLFLLPTDGFADTDPRIVYDTLHGRWVASEASWDCTPDVDATIGHGYLDIAISDTADPRGTWTTYYRTFPDAFPDYPGLGTSTDKVVISANMFDMVAGSGLDCIGTHFTGVNVSIFDFSDLANGGGLFYGEFDYPEFTTGFFDLRPSVQAPATSPTVFWLAYVANGGAAPGWDEAMGRYTGTVTANTLAGSNGDLTALITNPLVTAPPHQPGAPATIVDAFDERITDAVWQANKLTWVATYPCTPTGDSTSRDCVRVTQLDTTVTLVPALLQDFLVAENGKDVYMGGIGVTGNGALHVVWTRSSTTGGDFASTYGAYQLPTDPANSLSAPLLLGAGDSTYTGTRWGDYVGVAQDPQDRDAVWQGGAHSASAKWATTVTQMRTGTGSTYVPIAPVRVLNTTTNLGLTGVFHANTARTFAVAGHFGIPANATAITGNLAVTHQTAAGYVSVTVNPTNTPATSTLNFPLGDVRANNLTTPLSLTGTLSAVYRAQAKKTTDLVLDVTGYFLEDDSGATYNSMTPVRMLNTIDGTGLVGKFVSGMPRSFQVTGMDGVPVGATAITGNLAVTRQTAAGYVSVTPDEIAAPSTSTINFPVKDVRANGITVQLSATGTLAAVYKSKSGATTDLVLDVSGYYVPDLTGLRFFPLNPGRRLNTTIGSPIGVFHANVPQTIAIDGHEGVPLGAEAITGNLAVTHQTAAGYVAITPDPTATPTTSTLNFPLGDVRANGVTVPTNGTGDMSFVYRAGPGKTTDVVLDVTGYFK
jgi:hypothetical protein